MEDNKEFMPAIWEMEDELRDDSSMGVVPLMHHHSEMNSHRETQSMRLGLSQMGSSNSGARSAMSYTTNIMRLPSIYIRDQHS